MMTNEDKPTLSQILYWALTERRGTIGVETKQFKTFGRLLDLVPINPKPTTPSILS